MRRVIPFVLALAMITGLAGTARADVLFTLGNNPPLMTNEYNILFGASQSGTEIQGEVDHNGIPVNFATLTGQTLLQKAKGQADIFNALYDAQHKDQLLTSMKVWIPDGTFGDFIMNPLNGSGDMAKVTVFDNLGNSYFEYILANGENYLTITTSNGQAIEWVSIEMVDAGGFIQFKQPRISEVCYQGDCNPPGVVPEPASMLLLGSGLLGLGVAARRRRK